MNLLTRLALFTLLISGFASLALAQEDTRVIINTERPSIGSGPSLVPPHYTIVENGTTWNRCQGVHIFDGTESLTRVGVNQWLEVRAEVPPMQWRSDVRSLQRQDAALSAKIHLPSSQAWPMAAFVNLGVPVGSRGVTSGGWDPGASLAVGHTLTPRLSFTMSDALNWVSNGAPGRTLVSQMSISPSWTTSANTSVFAEFAPVVSRNPGGFGYTLDSGVLWVVHDRIQFDLVAGDTLDRDGQNHLIVGAGFSFMVRRR